ncbi:DUF721 domain-containing protein [Streptomyces sp. NBC_00377]|uniref:DciA family protein n=1 Tax=unclassified Streptomyces TaxID=2593676 RepID=UPI002E1DFD31|nr:MULTISPECIES: DciA family protein [unclassified Streptomyces]
MTGASRWARCRDRRPDAERAWELPAGAGATLRDRWASIAPELAGHVAAVSYEADSGRLTVRPESSAWATKARLEQTRVIAGRTVVRSLRILPPGTLPAPDPADVARLPRPTPPRARRRPGRRRPRATGAPSKRTARSRRRPGSIRGSRRLLSGRPGRCASCPAGRSPSPRPCPTLRRPRSRRLVPSAVTRPTPPTLRLCAGARAERAAREAGTSAVLPQPAPLQESA